MLICCVFVLGVSIGYYKYPPFQLIVNAKKIIADIKKLKLKIQIKIQGEELRAEGKKRDDLQEAIAAIEAIDIGLPIEFVNFRD